MKWAKAYISGPLQAAPDLNEARSFYEAIGVSCESVGVEAYLPHTQTDPVLAASLPASAVFERDMSALLAADIVIAHIGLASSGVGAEVAIACEQRKTVLAVHHVNERPSRFLLGLVLDSKTAEVITYSSVDDCCQQLTRALEDPRKRGFGPSAHA